MRQTHQFQHFFNAARAIRARQLAQAERHIQGHSQMWEQGVVLEHLADAAQFRRHLLGGRGNDGAVQQDAAVTHRFEAGDGAQYRGLAAAGLAHQPDHFAALDGQVPAVAGIHRTAGGGAAGRPPRHR
ncbi:hypothetical protein G6F68_019384 [Rhizopus microsporus]|nr:hypothetical protein G6F68_019384 [Rhizopus microsporus]